MLRALVDLVTGLCYAWTFRRPDVTGPHIFPDTPTGGVRGTLYCARCHECRSELFAAACATYPERVDPALGRYPCPVCGARLRAGFPHPLICRVCYLRARA